MEVTLPKAQPGQLPPTTPQLSTREGSEPSQPTAMRGRHRTSSSAEGSQTSDKKGDIGNRTPVHIQGEKVASANQKGSPRAACQAHADTQPHTSPAFHGAGMPLGSKPSPGDGASPCLHALQQAAQAGQLAPTCSGAWTP